MVQEMLDTHDLGRKHETWIATLALGLVQGVLAPAHSYETLYSFLFRVMLTGKLEKGEIENAERIARGMAFRRARRTFQDVPNLTAVGVCCGQDRVYLQGYRDVVNVLTKYSRERLFVGSISTDDLDDMEQLHILEPAIQHLYLSHRSDLFERITHSVR